MKCILLQLYRCTVDRIWFYACHSWSLAERAVQWVIMLAQNLKNFKPRRDGARYRHIWNLYLGRNMREAPEWPVLNRHFHSGLAGGTGYTGYSGWYRNWIDNYAREGSLAKSKKRVAKPKIQARNVILKKWRLATKSVEPNTSSFAEFQ
jgi:hypothetical protein